MKHRKLRKVIEVIFFVLIPLIVGSIGSLFSKSSLKTWYTSLVKPFFNPPNWIFGPVWTFLYILMGVSAYIVCSKGWKKTKVKIALGVFFFQLLLNMAWSILFFGLQSPLLAFIEIILLWGAILATIILFYRVSKTAAYLLLPYILWVSFAVVLNFSLLILNL
ncbi:MAG: TspO/MBR family protein [Candidatus Woesearchaeota archaeon]